MTFEEKRIFLQCLFAIAWVDGEIGATENAILATLFNHVELPPEDRETVSSWFDAPPSEPDWAFAAANAALRTTLLEQVFLVAASDGTVAATELGMMDRLREKLGVGEAEFAEIAQRIERIVAS